MKNRMKKRRPPHTHHTHHTGGVYSGNQYGPKPWASKNMGRHYGVQWSRRGDRLVPIVARSKYMPHRGLKEGGVGRYHRRRR